MIFDAISSRIGRRLALSLASCCALSMLQNVARADDGNRFSVLEENDSPYFHTDKHYTQGLRLSDLTPDIGPQSLWNGPFDLVGAIAPVFSDTTASHDGAGPSHARRYAIFLGQSIFTPKDLTLKPPDPRDRPYAGWLYVGTSLLQETNRRMLENLEIDIGVVGPGALGRQTQNDFHQFIGVAQAKGWSHEIQTEPGGMLTYERLWRVSLIGDGNNGVDIVPQLGGTAGNVMTYGDAGALLRIGKNLQADYGPARIRPAMSGTDYFDASHLDGDLGFYVFAGTQGRIVGQNIFLDGNSFRPSPSVNKKIFVADLQAGFSLFWSSAWRIDISGVRRTREYEGQTSPDVIGTATLSFSF
ncbi:MAG TPA: lipid A deacylase LpxR family protein [Telmatospirillum sp.]|nr:lipid A deacylase LpxR family protein [Telmatospirillum sp.]